MGCNICHHSPCTCHTHCDDCVCPDRVKGKCVFYSGSTTDCLGIITGESLDAIIVAIDSAICNGIVNPSANIYIVEGVSGQISVHTTTIGNTTTYTVSLSPAILEDISDIQSDIATLTACCNNSVKTISTDTPSGLDITDDGNGNYTINLIGGTSGVEYDGIIYNDTTAATLPAGSGTTVVVKSFNHNYTVQNLIVPQDAIEFWFRGKLKADSGKVDSLIVELFDATSATVLSTTTISTGFNNADISSYEIHGTLDVISRSGGTGLFTLEMVRNSVTNGTDGNIVKGTIKVCEDVAGIDYTNLTIRMKQYNVTSLNSVDNRCRQLKVKVDKLI